MSKPDALTIVKGSAVDRLLHRNLPDDYVRSWTARVSAAKSAVEPGTKSVVIFRIESEWLALPTQILQEVAEECTLHKVPGVGREILKGLVNIHGELLLCVSLEKVLGIEGAADEGNRTGHKICRRLLVCDRRGDRLAFPVHEILGLTLYQPGELRDVPRTLSKSASAYTLGILPWAERSVGCLDDEFLFYALNKGLA